MSANVPGSHDETTTAVDGTFELNGLATGSFEVQFTDCTATPTFVQEYFDDAVSSASEHKVAVVAGTVTAGVDAGLATGAAIVGTVRADDSGLSLAGVCVQTFANSGVLVSGLGATTGADGSYRVGPLVPGAYLVRFAECPSSLTGQGYHQPEWYADAADAAHATPLAAVVGAPAVVDASLAPGGHITGTVRSDLDGAPLAGECIHASSSVGASSTFSAADGSYHLDGLPSGDYLVHIGCGPEAGERYTSEYFDDSSTLKDARLVSVTAPGTATLIDAHLAFRLAPPASFHGFDETETAVFRPSTARWYLPGLHFVPEPVTTTVAFSAPGDVPVPGHWCNNVLVDEVAVFRPSTGRWYRQDQPVVAFGTAGDIPVPADYDGDGVLDIAVFRPSTGRWYIQGQPTVAFGTAGDIPVPGQWDDDEAMDLAVYRPSTHRWYVLGRPGSVSFGTAGDRPVPADYDGDGHTDIAMFRPSNGHWYVDGQPTVAFGTAGDIPVPGQWDEASGGFERAVFRPSTGRWYVQGRPGSVAFGTAGDIPVAVPPALR